MDERRLLRRSRVNRKVAGVCGGFGEFFDLDPVLVRVVWATLTIVPGAFIFGMIAYVVAWLMIPETAPSSEPIVVASDNSWRSKRLRRSATDSKIAGVCGGIAEYFGIDPTAVRVLLHPARSGHLWADRVCRRVGRHADLTGLRSRGQRANRRGQSAVMDQGPRDPGRHPHPGHRR